MLMQFGFRDQNFTDIIIELMNAIGKIKGRRFSTGEQAKPQDEKRR